LLDEPLAALDAAARRDNRALLRERLAAIRGPKLLVTHDREDLAALCAREYRLERNSLAQA
jgi:ABC-type sulfate/molybdate transport systems ATPase subunit